jgi:LacI family transcriptional regulator
VTSAKDHPSQVTIRDVATRAGVSTATVSRVLAGIGSPRPDTAAAVRRAAKDLGYRPSGVARSLRMRQTRSIGLIVTDIANPFFPEIVKAADDRARELGYSILLGTAAYDGARCTTSTSWPTAASTA